MKKLLIKPSQLFFLLFYLIFIQTAFFQTSENIIQIQDLQSESDAKKLSLQWNRNSINQSIEIYSKISENAQKTGNNKKAAYCLREIGRLWVILGNKDKAKQFFDSALSILKEETNFAEQSKIYSELSLIYLDEGELTTSRNFFEKALLFSKKTDDNAAQAASFYSAGEFYYFRNDTIVALDFYLRSIEKWQAAKNPQGEGKVLLSLGYLYLIRNEFDSGLNAFNLALSKFQEADDIRGQALTYKGIGTIFNHLNENQKALENFQKAESLFPAEIDYTERATLYNWFGKAFEDYGDWNLSLSFRVKAFNLFEKDGHLYGQLATLPSLGKLNSLIGYDTSALNYLFKAEKLALQLNDKFYLATVNEEIGNIYFKKNDFQKAEFFFKKALKLFQSRIYQKQIAGVFSKLGQIYQMQNDLSISKKFFTDSINLSRSVKDRFGEAEALYHLAKLNLQQSTLEDSLNSAKESIVITESLYSDVLNSKLQSIYFSNVYDRYELYINLLMRKNKAVPNTTNLIEAFQAAEKSRARIMLENISLSEANFTKDANPETVKREKEIRSLLNLKSDKLTDLLSQIAEKSEIDKLDNEINELEHELEEIKANLKQNSPIYSAIKNPEPFDVREFQDKVLDENSVLLEFSLGETESYLWLVSKDEISSYVLPNRKEIESKVENLRELIAARVRKRDETIEDYQSRIAQADKEFPETARQLSNDLFGQISGKLANKRLIIVPDGKLHYFPVSALPLPNSTDDKPILLSNEVVYEPSASTLALISKNEKQTKIAAKNLLVFSDPVFTEDDSRFPNNSETVQNINENSDSSDKLRFAESLNSMPRLTESKDEGDSILDIAGSSKTDIFTGFAATREHFLNANVSDYKILHFATHGLINENRPELSGIIFSRFNENREKLDEVVRLQDIYGLNLNADLVVLSACETGIGKEEKGEGLLSLNNGFLQVGAKTVLSSLWKVEDAATVELMKNFYEILADEKTTSAKALQKAQIKMWESGRYKSPFYWAAFTVQGDFTRKPDISTGFSASLIIAVLSVLFLIGGFSVYYVVWRRGQNRLRERAV